MLGYLIDGVHSCFSQNIYCSYWRVLLNKYHMNCWCVWLSIVWEMVWIIIGIVCTVSWFISIFNLHPTLPPITHVLLPCSPSLICPSTPEHNKHEVNPPLSCSVVEQLQNRMTFILTTNNKLNCTHLTVWSLLSLPFLYFFKIWYW